MNDICVVTSEMLTDADRYEAFCRQSCSMRLFRTSISTHALYMVRERLQAVKLEHFKLSWSISILLVRDQAQGFYSGLNTIDSTQDTISRSPYFNKRVFEEVVTYSLACNRETWD
ncbi:hypothetical protein N7449_009407 [Penicillium cf. viridicatum]|uniref:Uncharacterized protein n=1 Tax=Penicillium cf. viridicatum TaxID=2972119 RepID=A0A9W9JAB6_9EURO|nr:hypothetical protein N7449_009407 [Penicillium cf. viridicatum]